MESHEKERRDTEDWQADQVNIVEFLLKRCGLGERYSEELVHQVCGILAVNAFEARAHHEFGATAVRALYPQVINVNLISKNIIIDLERFLVQFYENKTYIRSLQAKPV